MKVWKFLAEKLSSQIACILILVVESSGSSPGRQGFKMGVAADGTIHGSIGGGIMEFKLVEKAKASLQKQQQDFMLQKQFHHKNVNKNQSGLICSGEQHVLMIPIQDTLIIEQIIKTIASGQVQQLDIRPNKMTMLKASPLPKQTHHFSFTSEKDWAYQELIPYQDTIHIIGAGHVGLALSRQMNLLNFRVKIYDDRQDLNTMAQNDFADEKQVVDYNTIGETIPSNPNEFVVIMSFGYRSDKQILNALKDHQFRYLGMMGSDHKIKKLFQEFEQEGILAAQLKNVLAPIGLKIYSKTPAEIAVSIAAEIIQLKNRTLPGGRNA